MHLRVCGLLFMIMEYNSDDTGISLNS